MKQNRAVFLDLNGTIVLPIKQESLSELTLIPGADLAITRLIDFGFVCPVVTVQSRIEKGLFAESEFRTWFADFFGNLSLDVKGPYICPHRFNHPCPCEKPNPFLYEQAASDFSIDLRSSYTIGDSPQDVEAARRFGGTGCFVKTGWAIENPIVVEEVQASSAFIGDTIIDIVDWIISRE